MNPEIIESFETGTKKVIVNLVHWQPDDLGVQIGDGLGNFTSFPVVDKHEGKMKAEFLANMFLAVTKR